MLVLGGTITKAGARAAAGPRADVGGHLTVGHSPWHPFSVTGTLQHRADAIGHGGLLWVILLPVIEEQSQ